MGFFKSLKGDHPQTIGGESDSQSYAPPPGPPPSRNLFNRERHDPPPKPPSSQDEFLPPPGPPPSQRDVEPPPYHDWQQVPDTALLPPPPSLGHTESPTGNSSLSEADRAHQFCRQYPLIQPHQPTPVQHDMVKRGDVRLVKPREYQGNLAMAATGRWTGQTKAGCPDACLLSFLPFYFAVPDSPLVTGVKKTIYYEVKVLSIGQSRNGDTSSIALGYAGVPYPTWRAPGWERGSLAVFSDDGRKFVNNTYGGTDFTSPILAGQTVGLGMDFTIPDTPPSYGASLAQTPDIKVDIFFTRDGVKESGWNLHEESDAENYGGVDGLDGHYDLYAAVGLFGRVEFEVNFSSRDWLWQPS
ncbi:MAG: hypothetical protein Q9222_003543 [Ikaeria aurantiellina]